MPGKLLYVINHLDWFWSHRLPLARGAQNEGWDVHVAVTGAGADENLSKNGFIGHELPSSDAGFMPLTVLKTIWAINALITREKPSLVHAITLKYAFMAGLACRFHKDVKIVHTIAGLGYLFSGEGFKPKALRAVVGPLLKLALKHRRAKLIFQNPDDQALMIKRGFAREAQCHLIRGSGVDLTEFAETPLPNDTSPIVLMPTRLVHDKGIAVFVAAARVLRKLGIEARFQIAGGVTQNNPRAISQEEMENIVSDGAAQWLGKVSDMPALYKAATLICYPSHYGEGVPKVLLEAAAIGRPIITTNHAGCREAVRDGINGALVPIKDANATAQAVIELLQDAEKCAKMGRESRKLAEEIFDVNVIVKNTLKVYQS